MSNPAQPATSKQVPDNAILDQFGKQTYLGNSFITASSLLLSSTSETPFLLITNPAVSATGFPAGYKSLFINLKRFSSTAQAVTVRTYAAPTITGSTTANTPVNLRPANANTSIAKIYPNGQFTVSANGTLMSALGLNGTNMPVLDNSLLFVVDPGQSLLITLQAASSTTTVLNDLSWFEL